MSFYVATRMPPHHPLYFSWDTWRIGAAVCSCLQLYHSLTIGLLLLLLAATVALSLHTKIKHIK